MRGEDLNLGGERKDLVLKQFLFREIPPSSFSVILLFSSFCVIASFPGCLMPSAHSSTLGYTLNLFINPLVQPHLPWLKSIGTHRRNARICPAYIPSASLSPFLSSSHHIIIILITSVRPSSSPCPPSYHAPLSPWAPANNNSVGPAGLARWDTDRE